jgi:hypothetical protein
MSLVSMFKVSGKPCTETYLKTGGHGKPPERPMTNAQKRSGAVFSKVMIYYGIIGNWDWIIHWSFGHWSFVIPKGSFS